MYWSKYAQISKSDLKLVNWYTSKLENFLAKTFGTKSNCLKAKRNLFLKRFVTKKPRRKRFCLNPERKSF